jgi:hypothetical protein
MEKKATVKEIINIWETGGISALKIFLNDVVVFEGTWVEKIKNLLEKGHIKSVNQEIELIAFNLNLKDKLYKKNKSGKSKNS